MNELYHPIQPPLPILSKVCPQCHTEKSLSDFPKDRNTKSGYGSWCKICHCAKVRRIAETRRRISSPLWHSFSYFQPTLLSDTKVCTKCDMEKPLSEFYPENRTTRKSDFKTECKACESGTNKAYNAIHSEQRSTYARQFRKEHPGWRRGYHQNWYKTRIDHVRVSHGKYYQSHRKDALIRTRKYRARHREISRERVRRYQALKRITAVEVVSYTLILEQYGYICHICKGNIDPEDLHFDHVVPISRGGTHTEDNIKPSHSICNVRKGNRLMEDLTPFHRRGPGA